ncbi:MAG: DEAD/DEAH box helicase [archaeon]|nr:MAG: DEAD/DEAH box helicase [archaeon]
MLVKELDIPRGVKECFLLEGIKELNPPQRMAVEKGILDYKSMVVASPTASGKTLIAELAFLKTIMDRGQKAVYIVPLRALAYEKYKDFKKYGKLGIKVGLSVGDYDSADSWLANRDLIIVTVEKLDSLLRHNPIWVREIGLIIADEIHLLNDESRGPTLEIVLTKLKKDTRAQILGLSATIRNAPDISEWLGAELVRSDYRPVRLYEGVYNGEHVRFMEKRDLNIGGRNAKHPGEMLLTEDTVSLGKQALIFLSSRRNAEKTAEDNGRLVKRLLGSEEKKELEGIADKILSVPSHPTRQCKRLASCIRNGTAFHHAGLQNGQRSLIEDSFRNNLIKIIAATPTLAAGVNLPAWRVIIRDAKRYYRGYGSVYIPVLEYQQMSGRAGRPKYDSEGEAILIGRNEGEAEELKERFLLGEPEDIYSKLSVEPVLRTHVLSLISTTVRNEEQLAEFFSKTFFAYQYGDISRIESILEGIVEKLEEQRFITRDRGLEVTRIGKRVAELYLDPETAYKLIQGMKHGLKSFDCLLLISSTAEMDPFRLRKSETEKIEEKLMKMEGEIGLEVPSNWDLEYDDFLCYFKTALVLNEWTEERGEDFLLDNYGVTPGGLRTKVQIADWLLYSCQELANLLRLREEIRKVRKVRARIRYGIREELVKLVKLREIGRVRARILYDAGFKTLAGLKKAPRERLADLLGPKVAQKVMEQLDEKPEQKKL